MTARTPRSLRRARGAALVEFALVALLLMILLFAGFEFCRMMVVYTNLSNAARVGARYAICHGSNNTGSGPDSPTGPGDTTDLENVVRNYARGLLNTSALAITTTYLDGSNANGKRVRVRVTYLYDPWVGVLASGYTLGATSEGIITF